MAMGVSVWGRVSHCGGGVGITFKKLAFTTRAHS